VNTLLVPQMFDNRLSGRALLVVMVISILFSNHIQRRICNELREIEIAVIDLSAMSEGVGNDFAKERNSVNKFTPSYVNQEANLRIVSHPLSRVVYRYNKEDIK